MNRLILVILALLAAVHVSVINIPAPVPVFLVLGGIIAALSWLIVKALCATGPYYRAAT